MREALRSRGFTVLRAAFDPAPLAAELDAALADGAPGTFSADVGGEVLRARFVPMMCERTPRSVALLLRCAAIARDALGEGVVPSRAKGVLYTGRTAWHRDSELPLPSLGFAAYLDPIRAGRGALTVVPGSHAIAEAGAFEIETDPGDLIVFDEHLLHASEGGVPRRQWRCDFGADRPADLLPWFRAMYPPGFDGGYDAARFPSYGPYWRAHGGALAERLEEIGAPEIARGAEAISACRPGR